MEVNPTVLSTGTIAGKWVWDKYGAKIVDFCSSAAKEKWKTIQWIAVEEKYRKRVLEKVGTTLLLGYPKPISIENIYTDVHVMNKITARRRFEFEDLRKLPYDFQPEGTPPKRVNAEDVVKDSKRIFILGKPGAGKTTFLKHLAILACRGQIEKTPIYLSLKEWADSGMDILAFIESQFEICGFPAARDFINAIFGAGEALILLDGLDEVHQEGVARVRMIQALENLANQYPECIFCLTCRIAAIDYTFAQFTYIEIADFSPEQQNGFVGKWYSGEKQKFESFRKEWNKADNRGLRELAQTPLLLALLCLVFDELMHFPKRRVELYEEALDALLKKWDSSRGISRSEEYRRLSLGRKKQLLSRIAAVNFQNERYLIRKQELASEISTFLLQLPKEDKGTEIEADGVISAIEYQHGLLVERAYSIYSFSHLTFQEYFTAKYIVDNLAKSNTLGNLIDETIKHLRWREVILMTSSLLPDATPFIELFAEKIWRIISPYQPIVDVIAKVDGLDGVKSPLNQKVKPTSKLSDTNKPQEQTDVDKVFESCLELSAEFNVGAHEDYRPGYMRSRNLAVLLHTDNRSKDVDGIVDSLRSKKTYMRRLVAYLEANKLLVECLRVSSVDDRPRLANMILRRLTLAS
ncbi:NACHT domain-containing protein [Cupriavidus basilensis]|uniref:NACHT domain-containing protein n=1 Tax=Cupriavidus basilensis TaxID=68895 RepID=UPI0020A6CC7C|nr:NACHT domain-containing protein [Cupriavidus basilensis]MCP3019083.1 NACHT domain-containing protein [Cupriavidus basilensis]